MKSNIFISCQKWQTAAVFSAMPIYGAQNPYKTCGPQTDHLFFGECHKIQEKFASISMMTSFFFFGASQKAENFCTTDQKRLKSYSIFTLGSERLHNFGIFKGSEKLERTLIAI